MNKKPIFGARKKARRYVLQALYAWMISGNSINDIETHTLIEHGEENFDREYFHTLVHEIPAQLTSLESLMSPHVSRKVEDMDPIELTILRIGVYELKERLDIPYRVVINESLELAKTFGATDSHKFVNGVLDKVAKELRISEMK